MNSVTFCYVFFTLVCLALAQDGYRCGIRKNAFRQLIYDGQVAREAEWPWHVAIMHKHANKFQYACGGSLIGDKHVLTAAHCLINQRNKYGVKLEHLLLYFGLNDLTKITDHVQKRGVLTIHSHPSNDTNRNDIAVLELKIAVKFSNFVIPICLDTPEELYSYTLVGKQGWIAGWGMTQHGKISNELQTISLPVVTFKQCVLSDPIFYSQAMNSNTFCAGDRNGTSPGTGDSGGGMYFSVGDRWYLRGIVSQAELNTVEQKQETKKFVIFVNVLRYLPWIHSKMQSSLSSTVPKRISEKECDRFQRIAKSSKICLNSGYPHVVPIDFAVLKGVCTGVLVNENHVLTTCNCATSSSFGKLTMVRINNYGNVTVLSSICHPEYKSHKVAQKSSHDIAILRLASLVELSPSIVPACLASDWTENLYDTLVTPGFRFAYNAQKKTIGKNHLYESNVNQVITTQECNRDKRMMGFNMTVSSSHLCVLGNDSLPDGRFVGLQGASLQSINTQTCMSTAVGVHGFGITNNKPYDGVMLTMYFRVAKYLNWIEETVWGIEPAPGSITSVSKDLPIAKRISERGSKALSGNTLTGHADTLGLLTWYVTSHKGPNTMIAWRQSGIPEQGKLCILLPS